MRISPVFIPPILAAISLFIPVLSSASAVAQEVPDPPAAAPADLDIAAGYGSVTFGLPFDLSGTMLGARFTEVDTTLFQGDIKRRLNRNLALGGTYILLKADNSKSQHTLRAHLDLAERFGDFSFDVRNSAEHRIPGNGVKKRTRVRAKFRATYHGQLHRLSYRVYASIEPHYDLTADDLNRVNYRVGLSPSLTDQISLDLTYMWIENKSNIDVGLFAVGLNFHLN